MHCPSCGAPATGQPKFCRACGFNLEKVAQLLAEQTAPAIDGPTQAAGGEQLQKQLQRTERWLSIFLTLFMALIFGGITWAVVFKMMAKGQFWMGLGLLLFVASAAATLFFVARREELQEQLAGKASPTTALPPAETTNKLLPEPAFDALASVAEPTTRQLAGQPAKETRQS